MVARFPVNIVVLWMVFMSSADSMVYPESDWLINGRYYKADLQKKNSNTLILTNGLVSRTFAISPDFATIGYNEMHSSKCSILRALSPEAKVMLNNYTFTIGGLKSSMNRAYFNYSALAEDNAVLNESFHYSHHQVGVPVANYPYKAQRHAPEDVVWPPKGVRLDVYFKAPSWADAWDDITVVVHYELYDNIPALKKWITVSSKSDVNVTFLTVEELAVNQPWARLNPNNDGNTAPVANQGYYWLYVETTWPHATRVNWIAKEKSAVLTPGSHQPSVLVNYTGSYTVPLPALQELDSFGVIEIAVGTSDPDRAALTRNRAFRTLQPQIQENPLFFHNTDANSTSVRNLIDQMAEVGFEMLIYSFGSGVNMESTNETYIQQIAADVAYAKSKGIEVGSYDLIVWTRTPPDEYRQVSPDGKLLNNACIASGWYEHLRDNIIKFMTATGMTNIETDGPYPGYTCSSTNHSHHKGIADSVYRQTQKQAELYEEFAKQRFYVHQPDSYFYMGAQKTALGYIEHQYALPRRIDLSVSRQGMYDDLLWKPVTQGWMFLPLVPYHNGGPDSTFEPLSDNAEDYMMGFAQYLGAGVAACYRGFRLYDSDITKDIVKQWVSFYKRYREILISDVVHIKRPDMQSLDGFVHVNPKLSIPALSMIYNPTDYMLTEDWTVPLYYSGLNNSSPVLVSVHDSPPVAHRLNDFRQFTLQIKLAARSATWVTFTKS